MENFALSPRKFLLMPSYYTHQEKLFDMCYGVIVSMATMPRPKLHVLYPKRQQL